MPLLTIWGTPLTVGRIRYLQLKDPIWVEYLRKDLDQEIDQFSFWQIEQQVTDYVWHAISDRLHWKCQPANCVQFVRIHSTFSLPTNLTPRSPHPPSLPSMPNPAQTYRTRPTSTASIPDEPIRIIETRSRPQCWDHGCNGRQFSTFSNLLRHQREKSGTATKSYCPRCGAEFTRTTARNGHMAHEKCKPRSTDDH